MMRKALPFLLAATFLAATFLAALVLPVADAHAAPDPRDFETRILHDHNDDSAVVLADKHGFDSIALDAREGRMPTTGEEALVLRLILNGGCKDPSTNPLLPAECPVLREVVQFSANGTAHEIAFEAPDDRNVWEGDAALYLGPYDINDGTRFAIEGFVPFSALGVAPGAEFTDWFVEGYSGDETADNMPEGAAPGVPDAPEEGAAYDIGTYTLEEPTEFLRLTTDATEFTLEHDAIGEAALNLANLVTLTQTANVTVTADDGITASIAESEGEAAQELALELAPDFAADLVLTVRAEPGTNGFATVTASTPLGGFEQLRFPVKVEADHADESFLQSPDILAGESWSHTFQTAGVFSYHNHHSPAIQGTITIEGAHDGMDGMEEGGMDDGMAMEPETHTVTFDGSAFDPAGLTINVGDTVEFVNDGDGMLMIMGGVSDDGSVDHDHMGHGDHEHSDDETSLIPTVPVPLVLVAAVCLAFLVRHRIRR